MGRLRISPLPRKYYRSLLVLLPFGRSGESAISQYDFERRRTIIARRNLYDLRPFGEWPPILRKSDGESTPSDLTAVNFADIRLAVEAWPESPIALALWKADPMDLFALRKRPPRLPRAADAPLFAHTFRVKDIDPSPSARRRKGAIDSPPCPRRWRSRALPRRFARITITPLIRHLAIPSRTRARR